MAFDMFMKLKGIDGEAKDKTHEKEIDVLAWSWGMTQSGSFEVGGGGGSGKVNVQDLSFTKYIDISSPVLMLNCSNGDPLDDATLTVRKAGKTPFEYLIIKMEKVLVTSVSTGGSGGEDRLTENVTLNFAKVEVTYKEQDDKGGEKSKKTYKWNIETNDGDCS